MLRSFHQINKPVQCSLPNIVRNRRWQLCAVCTDLMCTKCVSRLFLNMSGHGHGLSNCKKSGAVARLAIDPPCASGRLLC